MQDDDKLIDRDAWRRMLSRGGGEPPRATDERIRAEARRALAPRTGRWWLPASLAASLLLAVLVVQWQYEEIRSPAAVTESEVAPAIATQPAPAADAASVRAPAEQSSVAAPMADMPPAPAASRVIPPVAPGPRAAEQRTESAELSVPAAKEERAPAAGLAQSAPVAAREALADQAVTPEQWYARIEELRAAGRDEEADDELRRLEQAHPGWLERHLRERGE